MNSNGVGWGGGEGGARCGAGAGIGQPDGNPEMVHIHVRAISAHYMEYFIHLSFSPECENLGEDVCCFQHWPVLRSGVALKSHTQSEASFVQSEQLEETGRSSAKSSHMSPPRPNRSRD